MGKQTKHSNIFLEGLKFMLKIFGAIAMVGITLVSALVADVATVSIPSSITITQGQIGHLQITVTNLAENDIVVGVDIDERNSDRLMFVHSTGVMNTAVPDEKDLQSHVKTVEVLIDTSEIPVGEYKLSLIRKVNGESKTVPVIVHIVENVVEESDGLILTWEKHALKVGVFVTILLFIAGYFIWKKWGHH